MMMSDLDRKCKYARFARKICNNTLRSCSLAVRQTIDREHTKHAIAEILGPRNTMVTTDFRPEVEM